MSSRGPIEGHGGNVETVYYAFEEYDLVAIIGCPDNASAASFSLAASTGGAVMSIKPTPLITIDEGIAAMKKAGPSTYRPPGG